jgi:hypothetical protein
MDKSEAPDPKERSSAALPMRPTGSPPGEA